jgi:hypothetical protein
MSAIDTGISVLNNAVRDNSGSTVTNPGGAVANLQAAGNVAVTSVGPAIDQLSGSDPKTMAVTHMAWVENGKLAGVNNGANATATDVASASASVTQIATLYGQAQRLAQSLGYKPPPSAKAPTYAPPPTTPYYAPPPPMPDAPPPDASPVTAKRVITTGAGMGAGLFIGARLAGLAVGGPVGAIIGAGLGWVLGR